MLSGTAVTRIPPAAFALAVARLPSDPEAVARVVRGEASSSELKGYTAPGCTTLSLYATESHSCAGVLEVAVGKSDARAHYVVVDGDGSLACTCGGVVDSLLMCDHVCLAYQHGFVQLSVFAHCAPSVWAEPAHDALSTERAANVLSTFVHRRHPDRLVTTLSDSARWDRIPNLLRALKPDWNMAALTRAHPVESAAETTAHSVKARIFSHRWSYFRSSVAGASRHGRAGLFGATA